MDFFSPVKAPAASAAKAHLEAVHGALAKSEAALAASERRAQDLEQRLQSRDAEVEELKSRLSSLQGSVDAYKGVACMMTENEPIVSKLLSDMQTARSMLGMAPARRQGGPPAAGTAAATDVGDGYDLHLFSLGGDSDDSD